MSEHFKSPDYSGKGVKIINIENQCSTTAIKIKPSQDKCKWERNIDDNDQVYYITSCNESFHFLFSTLKCDPTFRYCPYCSKEIEEVKQ